MKAALAKVRAEATCPICLGVLVEPITVECGHNFCRGCIRRLWREETEQTFLCPVCRHQCQQRLCVVNVQLGKILATSRLLQQKRKRPEKALCEKHALELSLFCDEDQALLCVRCAEPPAHRGHLVRPVTKAAWAHRRRLRSYAQGLRERIAEAEQSLRLQEQKASELREQLLQQRRRLGCDFEELSLSLYREQQEALGRLAETRSSLGQKFRANVSALADHLRALRALRVQVTETSVLASPARLLRSAQTVASRCQALRAPALYSLRQRWHGGLLAPQHAELQKITARFTEDVRLDPRTAHPSLRVSRDGKSVTFVGSERESPWRQSGAPEVLGAQGFQSGRHYWEVQVGDKAEWAVGVCQGSSKRWSVQRQRGGQYVAQGNAAAVPVELVDRPRGVAVYLDWELGQVSFYQLSGRSHIHTFRTKFSHVIKPYFCVGSDPIPLIVGSAAGV